MIIFKKQNALKIFVAVGYIFLNSCGSTAPILSTPIENIDQTPIKISDLTEKEEQSWSHLDLIKDTIPGVSLEFAYEKLVKPKSKTVIVAVIDSGIDISHEDLKANVWINEDEIPNNGIDDDKTDI